MTGLLPWWVDVSLGGLVLAWAISMFGKSPMTRSDLVDRWGLLIFSVLLVGVGIVRAVP